MKTNKIFIVGGGSAGWMAAATLISQFPNKDITVIESPNIPRGRADWFFYIVLRCVASLPC